MGGAYANYFLFLHVWRNPCSNRAQQATLRDSLQQLCLMYIMLMMLKKKTFYFILHVWMV